jgi:hypothetical protein
LWNNTRFNHQRQLHERSGRAWNIDPWFSARAQDQLTLLFLTMILDLSIFIAGFFAIEDTYYCEQVPPLTRRVEIVNALVFLTFLLMGLAVPLLFLLWNLTSLATISGLIWLFFALAVFFFIWTPFQKWRKGKNQS